MVYKRFLNKKDLWVRTFKVTYEQIHTCKFSKKKLYLWLNILWLCDEISTYYTSEKDGQMINHDVDELKSLIRNNDKPEVCVVNEEEE